MFYGQYTGFGAAALSTGLTISTNTSEVNILTLATALGYDNVVGGTIEVFVNSGVTVSGLTTHAMQTGALHQNTILTINNNGNINGYTGVTGITGGLGVTGTAGAAGGDAIYIETDTGGTGVLIVNNASGAYIQSGGGGGGGGGGAGRRYQCVDDGKFNWSCDGPPSSGTTGAAGSDGGYAVAGAAGSDGTYPSQINMVYCLPATCVINANAAGGAGGAVGYAMRRNSRTVTFNDSGTTTGTVG